MTVTPEEKALIKLEVQYTAIDKKLSELPGQIEKMIAVANDQHVFEYHPKRNKKSYPPDILNGVDPRLKARLVNTIIAILSTGGTVLAMKFGLGG